MLSNRIAIVTGGGSGIGRAVCQLFAKYNASVVIVDICLNGANETLRSLEFSERHLVVETDISKANSVRSMYDNITQRYDKFATILVNCAGISRDAFLTAITEQQFNDVIDVNLKGTFLMSKLFCQLMVENKLTDGSIVNVSSVSAKIGNIGSSNYVASKAAIEGFTRAVAKEMANLNIRCNSVMPGIIDTPLLRKIPPKIIDKMLKEVPMGRLGKPEEVAEVIAFLASPKSSYMTGTAILVTGGGGMGFPNN